MGSGFSYEDRAFCVNVAAAARVVENTRRKASVRVGMVTGWVVMVDRPCVKVSYAEVMVRARVLKGARACEVVCGVGFQVSAAHRLVACTVGMAAIAYVNVGPRAGKGATRDGMVSATSMAASANRDGARVPMHVAERRVIAGEKSSLPRLVTGSCNGVSSIARGAEPKRVPTHTPGAQRAAIADGCRQQHPVHQRVPRDARGLADRDPEAAPTEHHRSIANWPTAVGSAVLRINHDLARLHGGSPTASSLRGSAHPPAVHPFFTVRVVVMVNVTTFE
jgi:hypothetical protein